MSEAFVELFKKNRWSNLLLLDVCAALDESQLDAVFPCWFTSVRATLLHLIANEEGYVSALNGNEPEIPLRQAAAHSFPGFDDLKRRVEWTGSQFIKAAEALQGGEILRGTFQGQPFAMRKFIPLMQAVHHGDEHRTHIKIILSQLGIQHPELDAWQYGDEQIPVE